MMNQYDIYYARSDFQSYLDELGMTEESLELFVAKKDDQIVMPEKVELVEVMESHIHGLGTFITEDILTGQLIAPARLGGYRTPSGRFTNHSPEPNTIFVPLNGDIFQIAAKDILAEEELTVNYRQAMDVNRIASIEYINNLNLSKYSLTQQAEILEWVLTYNCKNILDEFPLNHIISGGMYLRELVMQKDSLTIGLHHNYDHIAIMTSGDVTITTDEGLQRIQAPYRSAVKAGLKRMCYCHEESTWVTVHILPDPTLTLDDLDEIESQLFTDSDISWVDNLNLPKSRGIECQQQV